MIEQPIERPEFVRRLWDGLEGVAALGVSTPVLSNGKYTHEGMAHTYFDYSADVDSLLAFVNQAENGSDDIYYCPALRGSHSVRRNTATASRFLWADIDRPVEHLAPALEWLAEVADGLMLVRSGSGGAHIYVPLSGPTPTVEVEPLNRYLAAYLRADSKWSDNALLRLPDTLNHKKRILGGGVPTPVRAVMLTRGGTGALAGANPLGLRAALESAVALPALATPTATGLDLRPPQEFSPPQYLQQIIDEVPDSDRSAQTYHLVLACIEFGASDEETCWAALQHAPTLTRFNGREGHLVADVERLIGKARFAHPHPGLSCRSVRCPNAPRPQHPRRPVRRNGRRQR